MAVEGQRDAKNAALIASVRTLADFKLGVDIFRGSASWNSIGSPNTMHRVLKSHKHPVTALHLTSDLKQLLSGDSSGHLLSWILLEDSLRAS
ncbi:hypothetical protein C4D60_Mb03t16480 [Musa balbisiana]|uniref:Uncharacterized protein n=1 Tax=Musa balbisiana TaxID=52838 RepID=A0A4S8JAC0_MUSBA|nr:hypothetical protein C4D60_Mb03t16480 [Musa balbisiana]